MKITEISLEERALPLKTPFITAKRRLDELTYYVVKVYTDNGDIGIGGCSPTPVITGDTVGSIRYAVCEYLPKILIGREVTPDLLPDLQNSLYHNTSPKAALDIAIYSLLAKQDGKNICSYLGGDCHAVESDITVSIGSAEKVAQDIERAISDGFNSLKIKLGSGYEEDLSRIRMISSILPSNISVRFDANQAWGRKEAVNIINIAAETGMKIDLFEQPVNAYDIEGMAYVTKNTVLPVLADESVFNHYDAERIISAKAADLINIKLMKCGGIYEAQKIHEIAASAGIDCMMGCMMEGPESVAAAAMFASAKNISRCDLDAPFLCSYIPRECGVEFKEGKISFC